MHKTPVLKILIPFSLGILTGRILFIPNAILYLVFTVALILLFISFFSSASRCFSLLAFMIFVDAGIVLYQHSIRIEATNCCHMADLPVLTTIKGRVVSPVSNHDDFIRAAVHVDSIWVNGNRYSATGKLLLSWYDSGSLCYGDEIIAKGKLRRPARDRNPGEFNYREYLAVRNIYSLLSVQNRMNILVTDKKQGNRLMQMFVIPCRRYCIFYLEQLNDKRVTAFAKALLLGERGGLTSTTKDAFARAGIIHILAVSGLHVGFLLILLTSFFQFIRLKNPWRVFVIIICLAFYVALTGFKVPVVRAGIMAVFLLGDSLLQRPGSSLNSMALAAFILLIIQPLHLFQAGFQLSFSAVCGILLAYHKFENCARRWLLKSEEKNSIHLYAVSLFLVSCSAQLATLPLTAYYFGRIPILALFVNLVALPLAGLMVAMGFIALLFSSIIWPIGMMFGQVMWIGAKLLFFISDTTSSISFSSIAVKQPGLVAIVCYYLTIALFLFRYHRIFKKTAIYSILLLLNYKVWTAALDKNSIMNITFLDVGQGDAAVIESNNGSVVVIDTGDAGEGFDCGESVLAPFLQRQGIQHIDLLILTHFHSDHTGGASYLLRHFNIDTLAMPQLFEHDEFQKFVNLAKDCGTGVRSLYTGDVLFQYGKPLFLVLNPRLESIDKGIENMNDISIVISCRYKSSSVLFSGDAEHFAEKEMMVFQDFLKSDVLKVGHHGSATASSRSFRKLVDAKWGIVSVGLFNRHGLPSEKRLHQFQQEGTRILRTDKHGAVHLRLGDDGIDIKTHF